MAGVTNRGKFQMLGCYFIGTSGFVPATKFTLRLCTSSASLSADTNVWTDVSATELANAYGYATGGKDVLVNTGFDNHLESDGATDEARIQLIDVVWTGSGGNLGAARYAVLCDDESTPNVIAWFDLGSDVTVSSGQTLTIQNAEIKFTE